jgi:hypothetical protein
MKSSTKPSIVFCHGLWADGSCFSKLIVPFRRKGMSVLRRSTASTQRQRTSPW